MKAAPNAAAERELRAETTIDAPPEVVWEVLGDVRRMPELSPELVRMIPLKKGGLRPGQWYLGLNKRKAVLWPTRSVVSRRGPGPDGRLGHQVQRGPLDLGAHARGDRHQGGAPPAGAAQADALSNVFAKMFLGGIGGHADELEEGMAQSVARLKQAVEGRGGR